MKQGPNTWNQTKNDVLIIEMYYGSVGYIRSPYGHIQLGTSSSSSSFDEHVLFINKLHT